MSSRLVALLVVLLAALGLVIALHALDGEASRAELPDDAAADAGPVVEPSHQLESARSNAVREAAASAPITRDAEPAAVWIAPDAAVDEPTGRIHGRIVADRIRGRPLTVTELQLVIHRVQRQTDDTGPRFNRTVSRLDSAGDYSFEKVPLGRWSVRCKLAQHEEWSAEVELDAGRPDVQLDITLVGLRIVRITLLDAQRFALAARRPDELPAWFTALRPLVTPSCGVAAPGTESLQQRARRLEGQVDGAWYEVEVPGRGPLCARVFLGDVEVAERAVAEAQESVTLSLDLARLRSALGTVSVRVVDEAGLPVVRGEVALRPLLGAARKVALDTNGDAHFTDCTAGRATIDVRSQGFMDASSTLDVVVGAPSTLTIQLVRARRIRGRLLDAKGVPGFGYVFLAPVVDWDKAPSPSSTRSLTTNKGGEFTSDVLQRGQYLVTVLSPSERYPNTMDLGRHEAAPNSLFAWPAPSKIRPGDDPEVLLVDTRNGDVDGLLLRLP